MAVFETWLKSDLKKPLDVKQLSGTFFLGDDEGNLVGAEVLDGGQAATLSGDVYGYIIRDDDDTIVVQGTLSGNKASIVLPETAYAVSGSLSIVIKVGAVTVGACIARVYRAQTDTIADPDNIIPSVEELLQRIQDAEDACDGAETAQDNAETAESHAETYATQASASATQAHNDAVAVASAKLLTPSAPVALPTGSIAGTSVTKYMDELTEDHELIRWNFSVSAENFPPCGLSWETGDGYFTITKTDTISTTETIQPVFNKPLKKTVSSTPPA